MIVGEPRIAIRRPTRTQATPYGEEARPQGPDIRVCRDGCPGQGDRERTAAGEDDRQNQQGPADRRPIPALMAAITSMPPKSDQVAGYGGERGEPTNRAGW